jgi:hypothetical protein
MKNAAVIDLFPTTHTEPQPSRFAEFWQVYPKRVGKPLAKAKFDAITTTGLKTKTLDKDSGCYIEIELSATADEIIEGAKRYAKSQIDKNTYRLKDEGKYILNPATFLNAGRFYDEF